MATNMILDYLKKVKLLVHQVFLSWVILVIKASPNYIKTVRFQF